MYNPEIRRENLVPLALSAVGLFVIASGAFSLKTKYEIKKRDGGRSAESGETENLEAAHYDHSRTNPDYDTVPNGRLLDRREHYMDHYNRLDNGLNRTQNLRALRGIWGRMTRKERAGLPSPDTF